MFKRIDKICIPFLLAYLEVSLGGDGDKDDVIANANLLSLRALLGGGVNSPPAGLAFTAATLLLFYKIYFLFGSMEKVERTSDYENVLMASCVKLSAWNP